MCVNKDEFPWTPEDDAVIRDLYPAGGSRAVRAVMPMRTKHAVQKRASILRVQYDGRTRNSAEVVGVPWPVPTHDYCEADLALRQWGVPGMGTAEPNLGMPVGVLSPSLGLVLGVAA